MFRIISFFRTIILLLPLNLKSQNLQINEVVSKNYNGLESFEAKTEDWIEIFNNSNDTIQLQDYFLSDDESNLQLWQFPNKEIFPDSFLMVFASDENLFSPELHTNFKLSSKGEKLFLSKTNIIDSITIPVLNADFSYGRKNEQSNDWSVLDIPSPNKSNTLSNHLSFSHKSGFYDANFELKVESIKQNHTIYYTTNGSDPNINSLIYINNIIVKDRTEEPNKLSNILTAPISEELQYENISPNSQVNKATILKFASFYNGEKTSQTITKDFFINKKHYQFPVISLSLDENILFHKDTGIYVPGSSYTDINPLWTGNYFSKPDKGKTIHLSYFNSSKELIQNNNAEVKIHGGTSRRYPQKTLNIRTSKKNGTRYFDEIMNSKNINKFILKNTFSSWNQSILSDYLINNSIQNLDLENSNSRPVIVYVNGIYWGIHFLAMKLDKNFLKSKYNLTDSDDINIIEYRNSELIKGNNTDYLILKDYIEHQDLSVSEHYNFVNSKLDIDNFITYHIIQLFFNNNDWPANNCKIWNANNSKWRFLLFDLDATFSNNFKVDKNMFEYIMQADGPIWPNSPNSTLFFRKLIQNQEFKQKFIDRYIQLLENELSYKFLKDNYDNLMVNIPNSYNEHQARWLNLLEEIDWDYRVENNILKFYEERQCYVNTHIESTFNIESPYFCTFPNQNNLKLYPNPANNFVTIQQNHLNIDKPFTNYKIFDISGRLLKNGTLKPVLGTRVSLEKNWLGLYFIKIYSKQESLTQKFIIN